MLNFDDFKKEMLKRPDSFAYYGDLDLSVWGFAPFGTNRDAEIITQSNHEYVLKELRKVSGKSVQIMQCSHWAVGWCDHIMVKTTATQTMEKLYELYKRYDDYPILDEDDVTRREVEQANDAYDSWATFEVNQMARDNDIKALLDENGEYNPTPEQEETIRGLVAEEILDYGGGSYDDDHLIAALIEEFGI